MILVKNHRIRPGRTLPINGKSRTLNICSLIFLTTRVTIRLFGR